MGKTNYDDEDDDLLLALQSMEPCANCGADGAKIPCMSGCGEVFYCSRECNMNHASAHRLRCRNLRCSKFNDSDSESDSDEYEEFSDSDEYETDDGEEDSSSSSEEEEVKPKKTSKKKGKGKGGRTKSKRTLSSRSGSSEKAEGGVTAVDAEVEKRIEEKILKRLKKQEENRIATAIEQRMKEEKANWRDEEMNRIIMEMRQHFQSEMSSSAFMKDFAKKAGNVDPQAKADLLETMQKEMGNTMANPQAEEKEDSSFTSGNAEGMATPDDRARSASKESSWNNACRSFEALRVVVWKHSHLPKLQFSKNDRSGIWNKVEEVDADESFRHIVPGDVLLSVNGRVIDSSVECEEDLNDVFAAFASPLVFKFEAQDPENDRVHDYVVTWTNGPLGVTLKDDCTNQKIPIVNRLTKKGGSVAVKQNISIGDVLVAINNIDTIQLGCSLSMSILKKVQLPAKLRFRGVGGPGVDAESEKKPEALTMEVSRPEAVVGSRPSRESMAYSSMSRPSAYKIHWAEGPLGLTIIPGFQDNELPVIKKVTGTGASKGIERAQVGDFLESMNETKTTGMQFEKVVEFLKSTPKPIVLRFRSALSDDATSAIPASASKPSFGPSTSSPSSHHSQPISISVPPRETRASMDDTPAPQPPSDMYSVQWGNGPLGLTIDMLPNCGAYIKRMSGQGAASQLSQDCVGDVLLYINDIDCTRLAFGDIVNHLKNMPRPVNLHFRKSNRTNASQSPAGRLSDSPSTGRRPTRDEGTQFYNVVWQQNTPLGLSLRAADQYCQYPYITRVTGSGSSAHLPDSVLNDCLVSVDGQSVHGNERSFEDVMNMLKNMPKPLTLKFQSRGNLSQRPLANTSMGHSEHRPPPPQQHQPPPQQSQQAWSRQQAPPPPPGPPQASWRGQPPAPAPPLAASHSGGMNRSFMTQDRRGLNNAGGNDEKFNSIQAPFLAQNKLSTGRRQKMLKGLKK